MVAVLANSWALLFGLGLIMLGNGLQGSLLGVRASVEGFETTITGLVMSGYFMGLTVGCWFAPKLVSRVGHVRTFGAFASLASTSILVQAVFVDPWVWWLMRVVTGFSYAGLYIIAESWLNEASDNESRGQLLSFYMLISLGGMAGGQLLLNVAPAEGYDLFVLVSVLVSFAVIPILISAAKAPAFEATEAVSLKQLYLVSPLGVFGMFITGMTNGAVFGMGAVYATDIGMSAKDVSLFMGLIILGGFLFQYPIGWLSDKIGRRAMIIFCCLAGIGVASAAATIEFHGWMMFAIVMCVGGLTMPLYSLCSAHTNDYLTPTQMVAASGTLVLSNAIGATLGSPATAFSMQFFGPEAFYGSIAVMLCFIAIFALWRTTQRADVAEEDRGEFVIMAPTPLSASLTPEVELEEIEAAAAQDFEEIQTSFEELTEELNNPDSTDEPDDQEIPPSNDK